MANSTTILNRMFSLEGKTALVTGASGGIGRALSVGLAEAGAFVGLSGTNVVNLMETKRLVEDVGGSCVLHVADLGTVANCKRLIEDVKEALGGLDILFNNAGMNKRMPMVD